MHRFPSSIFPRHAQARLVGKRVPDRGGEALIQAAQRLQAEAKRKAPRAFALREDVRTVLFDGQSDRTITERQELQLLGYAMALDNTLERAGRSLWAKPEELDITADDEAVVREYLATLSQGRN